MSEQADLERLCKIVLGGEAEIEKGEKALESTRRLVNLESARAIWEISRRRLYLLTEHPTLEAFCNMRFGSMSRARIYQLINWAKMNERAPTKTALVGAGNERQARALASVSAEDRDLALKAAGGGPARAIDGFLDAMDEQERLDRLEQTQRRARERAQNAGPSAREIMEGIEQRAVLLLKDVRRHFPEKAARAEKYIDMLLAELRA